MKKSNSDPYHLSAEIVNYEFDTKNLVCLLISSVVGVWYLLKKVTDNVIICDITENQCHVCAVATKHKNCDSTVFIW